jgi:hypothetical protein
MQVYPELKKAPNAAFMAANSTSEDRSTIIGLLPPSSRRHGIRFSAAALAICFPVAVDPVKII